MGRELKRVAMDFQWPLRKVWEGYLNQYAKRCIPCHCKDGYAPVARMLLDRWYGFAPFRPEDRGSTPFTPDTPAIRTLAQRNVSHSPQFYGTDPHAVDREALRLAAHFNCGWSHHLNQQDVTALLAAGRLMDLTHSWTQGVGWKPLEPAVVPTPQEVNEWSLTGLGHDAINASICVEAECKRLGVPTQCDACQGHGYTWACPEDEAAAEAWKPTPPPAGSGYQMWETTSEGSPISPVFATAIELAEWLAVNRSDTVDEGTTVEQWMTFIEGPGWAPSMVGTAQGFVSGVQAVSHNRAP